jgi:hypothetical protein
MTTQVDALGLIGQVLNKMTAGALPKPPEKPRYMNEMTMDQAWDLARPKRPGAYARIDGSSSYEQATLGARFYFREERLSEVKNIEGASQTLPVVESPRSRPRVVRFVRQTFEGGVISILIGFGRGRRSGIRLLFMVLSPTTYTVSDIRVILCHFCT